MDVRRSVRVRRPRPRGPGTGAAGALLSWIGDERIAISGVPSAQTVADLAEQGVTHVVNCRLRVLIHCTAGRRRSPMLAYAVLRLRGHDRTRAAALVLSYRTEAVLVPAYVRSVERWLATAAL